MIPFTEYFQTRTLPSLGLLAFRLAMGSAFIFHGLQKVPHATTWMGEGTMPGIVQAAVAYSELLGGAALALGFLTPLATLALLGVMFGALFIVHIPSGDPFVGSSGGASYELALVYFTGALLFLLNSPGKFSVDYWLVKTLKPGKTQAEQVRLQA